MDYNVALKSSIKKILFVKASKVTLNYEEALALKILFQSLARMQHPENVKRTIDDLAILKLMEGKND